MSTADDGIDQLKGRKICTDCVGEGFLKDQISDQRNLRTCSYCGGNAKSYSIDEL
jgi:DnaJ-class molecular chaperone